MSDVICEQAGHPDCTPNCIHGTPHKRDTAATKEEYPHLPGNTLRDCAPGPCCTRGVPVQCLCCMSKETAVALVSEWVDAALNEYGVVGMEYYKAKSALRWLVLAALK